MSLSDAQESRITIMKEGLRRSFNNINKGVLPVHAQKTARDLHDLLHQYFDNYIDDVKTYLEAKNDYTPLHTSFNISQLTLSISSLTKEIENIERTNSAEKEGVIFVVDEHGVLHKKSVQISRIEKQIELPGYAVD